MSSWFQLMNWYHLWCFFFFFIQAFVFPGRRLFHNSLIFKLMWPWVMLLSLSFLYMAFSPTIFLLPPSNCIHQVQLLFFFNLFIPFLFLSPHVVSFCLQWHQYSSHVYSSLFLATCICDFKSLFCSGDAVPKTKISLFKSSYKKVLVLEFVLLTQDLYTEFYLEGDVLNNLFAVIICFVWIHGIP